MRMSVSVSFSKRTVYLSACLSAECESGVWYSVGPVESVMRVPLDMLSLVHCCTAC